MSRAFSRQGRMRFFMIPLVALAFLIGLLVYVQCKAASSVDLRQLPDNMLHGATTFRQACETNRTAEGEALVNCFESFLRDKRTRDVYMSRTVVDDLLGKPSFQTDLDCRTQKKYYLLRNAGNLRYCIVFQFEGRKLREVRLVCVEA